jgi:hypothetical protein
MRENLSNDTYRWGVQRTAEFFGVSRNRITAAYDELELAGAVTRIDISRHTAKKQPPRIVKLTLCSQISTGQVPVNIEQKSIQAPTEAPVLTDKHTMLSIDNSIKHTQTITDIASTSTVLVLTDKHSPPADELPQLTAKLSQAKATLASCRSFAEENPGDEVAKVSVAHAVDQVNDLSFKIFMLKKGGKR